MKNVLIIIVLGAFAQWWFKDPSITVPTNDINYSYIAKYAGSGTSNEPLPMLIALHGNGDTAGNFFETALDQFNSPVRIILIQGPLSYGRGNAWPWTAADFTQFGTAFSEAVVLLSTKYPTIGKPILLGYSGGGMMAYYQAAKHGDIYSSIFPISGSLSKDLISNSLNYSKVSVHAFHGKNDTVVSISGGREAVRILRAKKIKLHFTEFDGGHQGIFTKMKSKITRAVEQQINSLN